MSKVKWLLPDGAQIRLEPGALYCQTPALHSSSAGDKCPHLLCMPRVSQPESQENGKRGNRWMPSFYLILFQILPGSSLTQEVLLKKETHLMDIHV